MLENTESQEMYLTTIYALQKKNGMVRSVDVADERGYRSQTNIEKSFLQKQIDALNATLLNAKPRNITFKSYGDLYISFYRKGIVLEILNDTHLENACLYRLKCKSDKVNYAYECCVQNNKLVFKKTSF